MADWRIVRWGRFRGLQSVRSVTSPEGGSHYAFSNRELFGHRIQTHRFQIICLTSFHCQRDEVVYSRIL